MKEKLKIFLRLQKLNPDADLRVLYLATVHIWEQLHKVDHPQYIDTVYCSN